MEQNINAEIFDYKEKIFWGLTLRQSLFSILAILVAVGLYLSLKGHLPMEILSWLCILGAFPFAALGFLSYHGMPAEKLLWIWFRFQILEPKKLSSAPLPPKRKLFKNRRA